MKICGVLAEQEALAGRTLAGRKVTSAAIYSRYYEGKRNPLLVLIADSILALDPCGPVRK
jgi:hypothetical protein